MKLDSTLLTIYWEKEQLNIMLVHRQLCIAFQEKL